MANRIQLRRDTAANWHRVNPVLEDGEPGLDITTNQIKYGDGNTAWRELAYAGGGGGFTDVDGLVSFPGDLLIGTLWPEDPVPGGDKESVIWAKDDTEYLGMWWGGDQIYPENNYGPVAGIMIGSDEESSMTDDFTENASPVGTNITFGINDSMGFTNEWRFDRDGHLTLPAGGNIKDSTGTSVLDRISVTGSSAVLTKDQYNTTRLTFTGNANIETAGYLTGVGGLALVDSTSQQYVIVKPNQVQINTGFPDGGTGTGVYNEWRFLKSGVFQLSTTGIIENNGKQWTFGTTGNLTLPEGGTITSSSNLGNVVIQASSGTPRNFVFNTDGSITLPNLYAQGNSSIDSTNNQISLTSSDTVDFANFSGMVIVNCYNSGTVSMYLCGGGSGSASLIGNSKVTGTGTMAYNSGIGGYTFTATETGIHVFSSIKTRNGA